MRVEKVATVSGEDQTALIVPKIDGLDEPLVAEMMECARVDLEVLFGHDTEGADGGQGTAILAVQFIDSVTIDDQLALLAARQVEVVHQGVAGIRIVPVTLVVHARRFVTMIPVAIFTRIPPSSVRPRPLLA